MFMNYVVLLILLLSKKNKLTSFAPTSPQNIHTDECWQSLTDLDLIKIVDGMVCYVGISFKYENWNDSEHGFSI